MLSVSLNRCEEMEMGVEEGGIWEDVKTTQNVISVFQIQ